LTAEQKLDIISKNSFEGVIIVNDSGSIEEWNDYMVDKTGCSRNEVYGRKIWDVQHSLMTSDWKKIYKLVSLRKIWLSLLQDLQENEFVVREGQFLSTKNEIVLTEDIICRERLNNRNYLYVIQRDRGTRKKIDYEDVMTSIVSFQLESLINSLNDFSHIFNKEERRLDTEKLPLFIQNVISASEHTLELLENLLVFLSVQKDSIELNPGICNITKVVGEIIHEYKSRASQKSIELICLEETDLFCIADTNVLHLILHNLVDNAIKFTNEKGRVVVNMIPVQDFIEVSVTDNGIGIDNETKKKLFLMNSIVPAAGTMHEKGSGIGLVLTRKLIEKLGGKIWVESEPSKGSRFVFIIPSS
jgi:signal transduction histidine kinase